MADDVPARRGDPRFVMRRGRALNIHALGEADEKTIVHRVLVCDRHGRLPPVSCSGPVAAAFRAGSPPAGEASSAGEYEPGRNEWATRIPPGGSAFAHGGVRVHAPRVAQRLGERDIVGLAGAEQRDRVEHDDRRRGHDLGGALDLQPGLHLGARRAGLVGRQDEPLALARVGRGDDGDGIVGPQAGDAGPRPRRARPFRRRSWRSAWRGP